MHLQVDALADRTSACTSGPTLPPTSLDRRRHLLLSKYPTILRYRDTERHDISISSLGYDMNPS